MQAGADDLLSVRDVVETEADFRMLLALSVDVLDAFLILLAAALGLFKEES